MRQTSASTERTGQQRGELMESMWPNPKQIPFPLASSSTLEWQRVAGHVPDHLLWLVKRFTFPGELLQILDPSVLVHWMAENRHGCLVDGLRL
uniref:Uncharacterized protein n=1 Tax=Peronospora matthiolae TaxID=2874970 RepID=A0AAV1V660_9STRA